MAKSAYEGLFPDTNSLGKEVDYQGSRQIDNFSRRYYEKELGAGVGPSPGLEGHFGYTEPFRRFVQHETFSPQANEIPNQAASWLPGDDYYTNFHKADPFTKVDEGYARLPGAGYAAMHQELTDVDPDDYPTSIRWPSWPMWCPIHESTTRLKRPFPLFATFESRHHRCDYSS